MQSLFKNYHKTTAYCDTCCIMQHDILSHPTHGTNFKEEVSLILCRYNCDGKLLLLMALQILHDVLNRPRQNANENADTLRVDADLEEKN